MYSGSGFSDWEIGDITVIIHNGVYHLFHLIIPNHDYIAHAISEDGISWKRINNALFVGDPGEWDDDMLWTMHVCHVNDKFEMYYTGLQRKDRGVISRVGYAVSDDLVKWRKENRNDFPIEPKGIYYETEKTNPRTWLSFRDPFRFEYNNEVYLLLDARVLDGPVSRRGCVGVVKITNDEAELMPPLLNPFVYDDVECPCVFKMKGKYYLLGSIREDIKVHYWIADDFFGEYRSFNADVILPRGNYAARIAEDGEHMLVYNFFYAYGKIDALRVLPPPKQLEADDTGRLLLRTYYRWNLMQKKVIEQKEFGQMKALFQNPFSEIKEEQNKHSCSSVTGYQVAIFERPSLGFIWEGTITVEGNGKFELVSDIDENGNGYFFSINSDNGIVQVRAWGFSPLNNKQNFIFNDIQAGLFETNGTKTLRFRLIRYGHYIELAINDVVILTLIDCIYSTGGFGLYAASATIILQHSLIRTLPEPQEEYASQHEAHKVE